MKALCPYCLGEGCEACQHSKAVNAEFATDSLFTEECTNAECGFQNGGRIFDGESPPEKPEPCIFCKSPTRWLKIGENK